MCAGAALAISIGMKKGVTFDHVPFSLALSELSQNVMMPPMPVPMTPPTRALNSSSVGSLASSIASRAATKANCVKRSMRRASLRPISCSGFHSLTSPAMRVMKSLASKAVIGAMPDSPAIRRFQKSSRVLPIGVTAPSPVTTTRRRPGGCILETLKTSASYGGVRVLPRRVKRATAFEPKHA